MGRFRGVELADLTLSGERLDLRRWRPEDAERVHDVMQDRSMSEFLALPDPYTKDAAALFVDKLGNAERDQGTGLGSAVIERSTGRLVGSCSLHAGADPDIGYWIAADARGHGYAAEATRTLTAWANNLDVARVRLLCDMRNTPSIRTALRAGFRYEGVSRGAHQGGGTHGPELRGDDAVFARVAGDSGDAIAPAFPRLPASDLTDGVVTLRPARPDDAVGFLECDDDESARWAFDTKRRTADDAAQHVNRAGLDWLVGRAAQCTIVDADTGRFAGELQVRFEGPPGVAGFGYAVHPAFRGRGYTTRALRLIVPWCFNIAGFARLELGAKRDNIASQRAAVSAGFHPDGVRERRLRNTDGTYTDEVCFALTKPLSPA